MSVNRNLCLICQKRKSQAEDLSIFGDAGKTKLLFCAQERQKARDEVFSPVIVRIMEVFNGNDFGDVNYMYHRTCYAVFTNKTKIEAVKKKMNTSQSVVCGEKSTSTANLLTRSRVSTTNWEKCVICQKDNTEHLRLVMCKNMNDTILELAKTDYFLHIRTSAVGDLIAENAKYHSLCLIRCQRQQKKLEGQVNDPNFEKKLPFIEICSELRVAAHLNKVD